MASTSDQLGWTRRYCINSSSSYYDMKLNCTLTWNESYDEMNVLTCSNFRCSFSRNSTDNGYFATCPGEDGRTIAGSCQDTPTSYSCISSVPNGSMSQKGTYASNRYALGSASLGSYSIPGTVVLPPGSSTSFVYAQGGACTRGSASVFLRNPRSEPQPIPPTVRARAACSSGSYSSATFSATCNYGFCPGGTGGSSSYRVTDENGNLIKSGSGCSTTIGTLQANTKYNVRFNISNNCGSDYDTASVVTSTGNTITDVTPTSYDTATVRLVPIMGGNYYTNPTHTIQVARAGYGDWKTVATSNAIAPEVITFNGLIEETTYQIRCTTTNGSGCSYTSTGNNFTTPPKGICLVDFTSITPQTDDRCQHTWADVCCSWTAYLVPADIQIYYRVKDGYEDTWIPADTRTVNDDTGNFCFRINDIFPNQVVYEMYVHTHTEQVDWNSDIVNFTSPVCPEVESDNCASLTYMTEYLCASVKKLFHGNKKIYANPYSLALCDPFNEDPTHLTLWTRYLRLVHAYLCLLCDFVNLAHATEGQYLVGEVGWTNILTEIVEAQVSTDGWKLATSDAIRKYINLKLKQVWHYQDTVDVLVPTVGDLANYPTATSAIVTSENAIYTVEDGSWVKSTTIIPEDFGVFHINYESEWAKAESAWYYWGGTWNNLDADLEQIDEALKVLEGQSKLVVQNAPGQQKKIQVVDKSFDFSDAPEGDVVYFVTEPQELPAPTYYTVNFVEADGTIVRSEQVLSGTLAPYYTPQKEGNTFMGWYVGDEVWDNTIPITENTTIVASWSLNQVEVNFDLNGGAGDAPDSIITDYGNTIVLPSGDGLSKEGANFSGWEWNGVVWNNTTPVYEDITLDAIWDAIMLTVAIRRGDDVPDEILQVAYGTYLTPPAAPTKPGMDFVGWTNEDGTLFDFTQPITQNTVIVAAYAVQNVTVSFNAQTLPPDAGETVDNPPSQTISRGGNATAPVVTAENFILDYWTLNGTEFNFDTPVTEDITLVAVWAPVVVVEFDANGGQPEPAQQRLPEGGYAEKPTDPEKEGCEFTGWSEEPIYTVTFATGVPGTSWTIKVANGDKVTEPTYQPTREGYVFKGWEYEGESYDFDTPVTADITLNAIWNPLYTVTFDPGYEGAQITTVQVENGQTVTQPENPVNPDPDCTFEGWKEEGGYDPENPTLDGLKAAMQAGDYSAFPAGTEIPDEYAGNSNPLIVAQYLNSSNNSAYGGAEGVILVRKYVEPLSAFGDADYPSSTVKNILDTTYYNNCSEMVKNSISEIQVPWYNGSSVQSLVSKWFLPSGVEFGGTYNAGEGVFWDYYKSKTGLSTPSNAANNGRIQYDRSNTALAVWIRSRQSTSVTYTMANDGSIAYYSYQGGTTRGILPACFISKN